jgi:hypothetical protein
LVECGEKQVKGGAVPEQVIGKPSFIYHHGPYWLKLRGEPIRFGSAEITQTFGERFRFSTRKDTFMIGKGKVEYILRSEFPGEKSILWKNTEFRGEVVFPEPR